ncbi:rab-interacting lysosomal protein [Bombina bombina]|uniref:rab-interacting lysosomal protein n=1 Tax=Bombina bombina TaxID=8345 RepID=UPI00235A829F|nr:rab-interacting lysosomal protein [Bombina bombina]
MESTESVWLKAPGCLSVEDVYRMAACLGSELQTLTERFGADAVAGVVPQVVRVLELLESYAGFGRERTCQEEEMLIRAVNSLRLGRDKPPGQDLQQKLFEAQRKEHELQNRLSQLTEENQTLLGQLADTKSQEECAVREERDLMLKLKQVVDRQRDEIRGLMHENQQGNQSIEALQEQLQRFMKMNEDLRHKMSVVQAQLKSSLQRKTELEILLQEKQKEIDPFSQTSAAVRPLSPDSNMNAVALGNEEQNSTEGKKSNELCFTKEDVKQIVQERNELKTNLFLVNEELQYYQRELLNDERIPSLLLCGMKSAIRKQRKKIKAKMLGIVESPTSSDEEDSTWTQTSGTDCVDSRPRDSKIRSLFGMWYSKQAPDVGAWEIINAKEINLAQKPETISENE